MHSAVMGRFLSPPTIPILPSLSLVSQIHSHLVEFAKRHLCPFPFGSLSHCYHYSKLASQIHSSFPLPPAPTMFSYHLNQRSPNSKSLINLTTCMCYSYRPWYRAYRKRLNRRLRLVNKPVLDQPRFNLALSQLPARFTAPDLHSIIAHQDDPLVCLELFRWSSKLPRFNHTVHTFHITLQKLALAGFMDEMYELVDQLLSLPHLSSEPLFNTIICYFTRARKLSRAISVFKHMKKTQCRPSIETYNLLFAAFLSRGPNTFINHVYMGTMESLFRQLLNDGIKPDIFCLNSMIQGYVLSNHVNDALRIFHQMAVVYSCDPDAVTYDHLIHGLCVQGRTNNAIELFNQTKGKGFVPSAKTYNSLINAFALAGELQEALIFLWEMTEIQRPADFITYKTLLHEFFRKGQAARALSLLEEFEDKGLVDSPTYNKLFHVVKHNFTNSGK